MNFQKFSEWYAENFLEETFYFLMFLTSLIVLIFIREIKKKPTSIYDFLNQTLEE